jgi:ligand-binding sensor domain-containing protein
MKITRLRILEAQPITTQAFHVLGKAAAASLLWACAAADPEHPARAAGQQTSSTAPSQAPEAAPVATGEIIAEIDSSCWVVFQDKDDNYWFGSDGRGVCRYDGKTLTRFTTKDGLSHDEVRGIQQHAPSGHILISTNGGVSRFDGERFVTLPVLQMQSPDEGWLLDDKDVWIQGKSGPKGPCRYDGKTLYALQFTKSPRDNGWIAGDPKSPWNPYDVWCVYKDRKGHMWFGTATLGVCRFDGKAREWMFESHLSELPGDALWGIRAIIEDRDGAFWICNTQYRFEMHTTRDPSDAPAEIAYSRRPGMDLSDSGLDEPFFYFMSITQDDRGHLWMAPYAGGVFEYDGAKVTHYPMRDAENNEITMFSISRDNHGGLWVSTHEHGAYRFNGKSFERFRT